MGKINLLKAGFSGQVGETYGVESHGKQIIKAVPFSHAPHNIAQKRAVRAFTYLNRFASNVAKYFFQYLPLSAKGCYKNNAVSKWLKVAIDGGVFSPEKIGEVIPSDNSLRIQSVEYDLDAKTFTVKLQNTLLTPNVADEKIYCAFVTNFGSVKWSTVAYGENLTLRGSFDYLDFSTWYIIAFKSVPWYGKKKICGFSIYSNSAIIVVNGIWYLERQTFVSAPYVVDGVLYLPEENVLLEDGTLRIIEL